MSSMKMNSMRRCNVKMSGMRMNNLRWNNMKRCNVKMNSVRMSITEKPKRAISSNVLCGSFA